MFEYKITRLTTGASSAHYKVQNNEGDVIMSQFLVWLGYLNLSFSNMHFQ